MDLSQKFVPRGGYATTSAPDAPALDVQSGVLCFEVTALQLQLGHCNEINKYVWSFLCLKLQTTGILGYVILIHTHF